MREHDRKSVRSHSRGVNHCSEIGAGYAPSAAKINEACATGASGKARQRSRVGAADQYLSVTRQYLLPALSSQNTPKLVKAMVRQNLR
jgi:hypothetical protein